MHSLSRLPALQALLIQSLAFALVLSGAFVLSWISGRELNLLAAAFIHGLAATTLALMWRMPRWWLWIHFLFAPALLVVLALQLPSWIYLLLFTGMLGLYWQTFRTRVPYYPSTRAVRDAAAALLPAQPLRFVDIGSGFGGLVIDLAQRRPDASFAGIEMAPMPWLFSVVRARVIGSRARFMLGDYSGLDLGGYDVVFAYLSSAAMPDLWAKARAEMRPGTLLLSYEFDIPGAPSRFSVSPSEAGPQLYGWRF